MVVLTAALQRVLVQYTEDIVSNLMHLDEGIPQEGEVGTEEAPAKMMVWVMLWVDGADFYLESTRRFDGRAWR